MPQQRTRRRGPTPGIPRLHWPKDSWMRLISKDRLYRQMKKKGYGYQSLADDVNCSKAMISHLVKGRRATLTPALAEAIAARLGVDLDMLFVPSTSLDKGTSIPDQARKVAA